MIGKLTVEREKGQVHIVLRSMGPKEARMMDGFYRMAVDHGELLPEGVKVVFTVGRAERTDFRYRAVGKWNGEKALKEEHQVFLHFSLELEGTMAGIAGLLTDGATKQLAEGEETFGGYTWKASEEGHDVSNGVAGERLLTECNETETDSGVQGESSDSAIPES